MKNTKGNIMLRDSTVREGESLIENGVLLKRKYLHIGGLVVASTPHMLYTVLGSCVSVCFWDPVRKVGGMNHYSTPLWRKGPMTNIYGEISLTNLYKRILATGATRKNLVASVFGGARVLMLSEETASAAEDNIALALKFLKTHEVPVVSRNTGGNMGRKIYFNTSSGRIKLSFVMSPTQRNAEGCAGEDLT